MRMTEMMMGLALAAALAACGKPTPGRSDNGAAANASANAGAPAETATAAAPAKPGAPGGVTLNPGQWETVTETAMTGIPAGMPPAVAEKMKSQKMTSRHCLTPEKAAHPGSDFFGKASKECTNNVVMAGGRVSGSMTCKSPGGSSSVISIDGQYGGDSMEMAMKMDMNSKGQSMSMTSHMVGHRVGECPAGAKDD
ncbi:MAG TPA: DUF3617 domain-containing protein [Allosphingosinicella sp.]|nr:DUF3617 domain-containing protein [Allosphingosinicella sp.]